MRYSARTEILAGRDDRFGPSCDRLAVEVRRGVLLGGGRLAATAHRLGDEAAAADRGELAAQQVLEDVGEVDREVEADRALLAQVPPGREHDPVVAADEGRRRQVDVAEHAGLDHGPREPVRRAAPPLLLDRQDGTAACGRLGHDLAAEDRDRQRLLAQDVAADEERRDRDPVVGRRFGGDVDGHDRVIGEDLVERGHDGRPAPEERLGVLGAARRVVRVQVAHRDEVEVEEADVVERGQPAEVAAAHRAGSHEGERQPAHGADTLPLSLRTARGTSIRAGTARSVVSPPRR